MKLAVLLIAPQLAGSLLFGKPSVKASVKGNSAVDRRGIFKKIAAVGAAAAVAAPGLANAFDLPDLPYSFEALEPFIDAPTMKIHHDKHHQTYVTNINKVAEGNDILALQKGALSAAPGVRNSGGGHYNHAFFWDEMTPAELAKKTKRSAQLEGLINSSFGSFDAMKEKFEAAAAPGAVFGSGWVWVCVNKGGDKLSILGTPNQDNPLMDGVGEDGLIPILGIDVWEHAYYLKYQNRRPEYVTNWFNVVNWDKVSDNCKMAVETHAGIPVRG